MDASQKQAESKKANCATSSICGSNGDDDSEWMVVPVDEKMPNRDKWHVYRGPPDVFQWKKAKHRLHLIACLPTMATALVSVVGSYVEDPEDGKVYDVAMTQTNVGHITKFYYVQLLEKNSAKLYGVFIRWGRVGSSVSNSTFIYERASLESAKKTFERKYAAKAKTYTIKPRHYETVTAPRAQPRVAEDSLPLSNDRIASEVSEGSKQKQKKQEEVMTHSGPVGSVDDGVPNRELWSVYADPPPDHTFQWQDEKHRDGLRSCLLTFPAELVDLVGSFLPPVENGSVYEVSMKGRVGGKYHMLLLAKTSDNIFGVWTRWSRVGKMDRTRMIYEGPSLADAKKAYEKKYNEQKRSFTTVHCG